jgi:hypothetical protein
MLPYSPLNFNPIAKGFQVIPQIIKRTRSSTEHVV